MGLGRNVVAILIIAAVYKLNPLYIRSSIVSVASSFTSITNLAPPQDPRSLKAAFANVTADYDQLTSLLEDFFERMADNTTETLLRDYLLIKASRKHKILERFFDWMLSVYWFVLPFVLVYAGAMMFGGGGSSKSDEHRIGSPEGRGGRSLERYPQGQIVEPPFGQRGRTSSTHSLG